MAWGPARIGWDWRCPVFVLRCKGRSVREELPAVKARVQRTAMQRLLPLFLGLTALLSAAGALACEKHLNGHQTSSDTTREAVSN